MAGFQVVLLTSRTPIVRPGRPSARPRSRGAPVRCSRWHGEKSVSKFAPILSAALALTLTVSVPDAQAGLLGGGDDKDPIEPFSIFGTVYKQYVIEILDESGRAIIGRQKGFTAEACIDLLTAEQQRYSVPNEGGFVQRSPDGPGEKVTRSRFCEKRTVKGSITKTEQMMPACVPACRSACFQATQAYDGGQLKSKGFGFTDKELAKVKGTCSARCEKECTKPGKSYVFQIPFRRGDGL